MYEAHPSRELNANFAKRPYQGVEPWSATYLFVGLDANYDPNIERNPIFPRVLQYHEDGVGFWRGYGVHHPFLLPEYTGDGRRYHKAFARIGFGPKHAALVSFVELLHVPTVGRSRLTPADLHSSHLQMLNSAILEGKPEHIFVSASVMRLMHDSKAFPWLSKKPTGTGPLPVLYSGAGRKCICTFTSRTTENSSSVWMRRRRQLHLFCLAKEPNERNFGVHGDHTKNSDEAGSTSSRVSCCTYFCIDMEEIEGHVSYPEIAVRRMSPIGAD
jgi:hypothetical protein